MAKATAAKTKPAAKKPVKQQLKSPKKARNTSASVNKGQISGFLTGIKYKANNPKDPQTSSAQQLLEAQWCCTIDVYTCVYVYLIYTYILSAYILLLYIYNNIYNIYNTYIYI